MFSSLVAAKENRREDIEFERKRQPENVNSLVICPFMPSHHVAGGKVSEMNGMRRGLEALHREGSASLLLPSLSLPSFRPSSSPPSFHSFLLPFFPILTSPPLPPFVNLFTHYPKRTLRNNHCTLVLLYCPIVAHIPSPGASTTIQQHPT